MKPNIKALCIIVLLTLIKTLDAFAVDQPQSTVPEGDQFSMYDPDAGSGSDDISNGNATPLNLSTPEVPNPPEDCWDAEGDPDYYWDFGSLDGVDNGDGTATIYPDVAGEYDVTVYCGQNFVCHYDSSNTDYEETLPSDPLYDIQVATTVILDPNTPSASGSSQSDPSIVGWLVHYLVVDQNKPAKPLINSGGTIAETLSGGIIFTGSFSVSGSDRKFDTAGSPLMLSATNAKLEAWEQINANGQFKDLLGTKDPGGKCLTVENQTKAAVPGATFSTGNVMSIQIGITSHTYSFTGKDGRTYSLSGNFSGVVTLTCIKQADGTWSYQSASFH